MHSESDTKHPAVEAADEPRDRTWMIWVGVGLLFVVMVGLMATQGRGDRALSEVRISHILVKFNAADPASRQRAHERASSIRERILAGEDFGKLAREYSEDPYSAKYGGDLDYAPRNTYAEAVEEFAWSADIGAVSEVLQTSFGYHIVRLEDRYLTEVDRHVLEQQVNPVGQSSPPAQ